MTELPIPPKATTDDRAIELVRAWAAHGCLHSSLELGVWGVDEVGAWGIMLADLTRHVANAMKEQHGVVRAETIAKIRAAFDAEMDSPTDEPTGDFV